MFSSLKKNRPTREAKNSCSQVNVFLFFSAMQPHGLKNRLSSTHLQISLLIEFLKYSLDNLERSIELESDFQSKRERLNDLIEIEVKQVLCGIVFF